MLQTEADTEIAKVRIMNYLKYLCMCKNEVIDNKMCFSSIEAEQEVPWKTLCHS